MADLAWLIREHLGEEVEVLAARFRARSAAPARPPGSCAAGWTRARSREAVERTGARVVHAHNLQPTYGWRALAAARAGRGPTVLHLHNYRLVCAVGTCFTRGEDCTRCHGLDTLPGRAAQLPRPRAPRRPSTRRGSRCGSAGIAAAADALPRPQRLRARPPARAGRAARRPRARPAVGPARVRAVLDRAPRRATCSRPGDWRRRRASRTRSRRARAAGCRSSWPATARSARCCARAARWAPTSASRAASTPRRSPRCGTAPRVAVVPSRYAEILPLAALEAMAAGLPVAAARSGGLAEAVPREGLYAPGDVAALADRLRALVARRGGRRARARGGARPVGAGRGRVRPRGRLRRLIADSGTRAGTAAAPAGAPPGG